MWTEWIPAEPSVLCVTANSYGRSQNTLLMEFVQLVQSAPHLQPLLQKVLAVFGGLSALVLLHKHLEGFLLPQRQPTC